MWKEVLIDLPTSLCITQRKFWLHLDFILFNVVLYDSTLLKLLLVLILNMQYQFSQL